MTDKELIAMARQAAENADVPYSHFSVGAALLDKNGNVHLGCNIENASYGATNCAERTAIFSAVAQGIKEFEKIAIVCDKTGYPYPCGICRQVMSEFMPDAEVLIADENDNIKRYTVRQLLPEIFVL